MYFEEISCPICYSEFDDVEHIPRVIPSCGHTLCLNCLRIILQNDETKKCPLDQKKFESYQETEENFPINYTVKNIIEKIVSHGICKEHRQVMNLICRTDNCKVCEDCVFHGEHKSHKIETIRNLRIKLNRKKDELVLKQRRLQKFATFANDKFDEHLKEFAEIISLKFESLRAMLFQKEVQLLQDLNNFFDSEKAKINNTFGQESLLVRNLRQAIATVNNENADVFQINEEQDMLFNFSEIEELRDSQGWSSQIDLKLENIKESIDKMFNEAETNLFTKIEDLQGLLFELVEEKFQQKTSQFMTQFKFDIGEEILQISQKAERGLEALPEDLYFKELQYDFKECRLQNEDKRFIGYVSTKYLKYINGIKFFMQDGKISDESLLSVYPTIFWNIEDLKRIEANFRNCSIISDKSIIPLVQNHFFKIKSLNYLSLTLNHTKISPKSVKCLAKLLKKNCDTLVEVKLYFYNTSVTDDSICELFTSMPNIKTLVLSLTYTEISDRVLDSLVENELKHQNILETIELYLGQTQITDRGLINLLEHLPLLKTLKLGLECTKVTDDIVSFLNTCLPVEMKSLKELNILISETSVSQKGQDQLLEIKKKFI